MPSISTTQPCQTVVTTFEVNPGQSQDLMHEITRAYDEFIRHQNGFLGAGLHINDAQTRIANYAQWERREDFQSMLRSNQMQVYTRRFAMLCQRFEPVLYDVEATY